jgi:dihydroneopterin aldolase
LSDLLHIYVHNCRFRAFHGLYPEERQKGNDFVVNLAVAYSPESGMITALEQTIDYAALFKLVEKAMQEPVDLLETLAQKMAADIEALYPQVKEISIEIEKLNPPIDQFTGSVSVKLVRLPGRAS